jgi:hypothetical protein
VLPQLDAFVSRDAFDKLETVAQMLGIDVPPLYFFDRTGFSDRLREIARERPDVHLISTAELAA